MHIAFLDTNTDRSAFGLSHPSECEKFRALLGGPAPDWRYSDFRVSEGQFPDDLAGYDGVMISGSIASVNDPDAWIARLLDGIRAAKAAEIPVFGACFGHQAIAKALGGEVGKNPQGWVLGPYETHTHAPAIWMDRGGSMVLQAAHKEQVLRPPPGTRIHAGTEAVPIGHLSIGNRIFGTQYHPELDRDFMAGLFDEMADLVAPEVLDQARDRLSRDVDDARMARWIVAFFEQALR